MKLKPILNFWAEKPKQSTSLLLWKYSLQVHYMKQHWESPGATLSVLTGTKQRWCRTRNIFPPSPVAQRHFQWLLFIGKKIKTLCPLQFYPPVWTHQPLIELLVLAETNNSLIMMIWVNITEWEMWQIGAAGSKISCSGWIIYAGLFSPPCKCGWTISPRGGAWRVWAHSLGTPIFQLINFIFTHLFLNVVSDGNAAGSSSEVLTWQMGL